MISAVIAVLALGASVAEASPNPENDQLWSQGAQFMEPVGIDRQMFDALNLWIEGQYYLGYCDAHWRRASEVAHYRTWWDDTIVAQSEVGRKMISLGSDGYQHGLSEGRKERPGEELCQRTINSWLADLRAAMPQTNDRP